MTDEQNSTGETSTGDSSESLTREAIAALSDEDLQSFLNSALGKNGDSEHPEEASQEIQEETPEAVPGEDDGSESSSESDNLDKDIAEETDPEKLRALLKEERAKSRGAQQEKEQKEQFIQKRNQEVGFATRRIEELQAAKQAAAEKLAKYDKNALKDLWTTDPEQASRVQKEVEKTEQELQTLQYEESREQYIQRSKEIVTSRVKADEVKNIQSELVETLADHGIYSEDDIRNFIQKPYETLGPETILAVIGEAKARRATKLLAAAVKELVARVKKAEGKPQELVQKIEKNLSRPKAPPVRTSSNGSKPKTSDVTKLDRAALQAIIKENNLALR